MGAKRCLFWRSRVRVEHSIMTWGEIICHVSDYMRESGNGVKNGVWSTKNQEGTSCQTSTGNQSVWYLVKKSRARTH